MALKSNARFSSSMNLYLAQKILLIVMCFRRMSGSKKSCVTSVCDACFVPHLPQVISAIKEGRPITFVLPAFPAKSPNPAKVLGILPDMAEKLALEFLNNLCQQIQKIYPPGAHVILCADGRVFNDVVGIRDIDVTLYQQALSVLIKKMSYHSISLFNLDDLFANLNFEQMRHELMSQYGEPLSKLQEAVHKGSKMPCDKEEEEIHRQYCGITRFLVDDALRVGQSKSRNAIQKSSRNRAYIVIQRSRAWSNLILDRFPQAIRLSIHPQSCGATKLGIHLIAAESWMTPWHGVAVDIGGQFVLLKRAQAEQIGANLIYRDGQPSHYELIDKKISAKFQGAWYGI